MIAPLSHLDLVAREWVVTHRVASLDGFMWLLSVIGRGGVLFVALGAVAALRRRRARDFVEVVIAVIIASVAADRVLKPLVQRQRPFEVTRSVDVIGGKPNDASMPSGHAANAVAGAVTLSQIAPEAAAIWWALAVMVAYSRVYLGVHYPGDVLAGGLVGLCSGIAAIVVVGVRRSRSG